MLYAAYNANKGDDMPVTNEEFERILNNVRLSSWDAEEVYSGLPQADLDEAQKATLKQTYDLREFYRDEILAHLSYNLIPKEGPEENLVRNSITKIGFLNNNYQFAFVAANNSKKIEAWRTQNMSNPNVSVLIVQQRGFLRGTKSKVLVLSDGVMQELAVTDRQLAEIIPSADASTSAATEITPLESTEVRKKALADIYQKNGLHIPFKLCAQNDRGEYFIPNREDKFSWKRTEVALTRQIHGLYDVKRFTRDAVAAARADVAVPTAGSEITATGAGVATSVDLNSLNWVNDALKCFVLSPHIEAGVIHPEAGKVTMLWAGTHDGATARADAENNGAGYQSFSRNKEDFLQLMRPIIAAASHDGRIGVTACGHSLGGALSQLSLEAVLSDYECRTNIGALTLAIKNSTGVAADVARDYKALVETDTSLRHETRAILVDGDAVQQTGESTLGCDIAPTQCKLSLCKVVSPFSVGGAARAAIYGTAALGAGAALALAAAPATAAAAALWFVLGSGVTLGGITAAGARGAYEVHTRQYFNGGLKDCGLVYYNSETPAGSNAIQKELLYKSVLPAAGLRMLHGDQAEVVTASANAAPDVPIVAEGVVETARSELRLPEDVRFSAATAAEPATRLGTSSPQSASSTDASVMPPPASPKGARRDSKSPP